MQVTFLNVYALAAEMLPEAIDRTVGSSTKVLGVTVLTHYNDSYCHKHFSSSLQKTVRHLAEIAIGNGCHGIILPGTALHVVADLETIKLVPGIRPVWYSDNRHEEEVTPTQAIQKRATDLVCGSPIMKSNKPTVALDMVLSEIKRAETS
jgi:orotidine-5'-phosphate decarboxylase